MAAAAMGPESGFRGRPVTRVASRYEILRSLGEGGMGRVYEAHDIVLDEMVALKVLRSDILAAPDLALRFRTEIKLARKVSHRNVCRIYEYGEEGDRRYISMELVEGQDVRRLVAAGPLPWDQAYDIAIQAAEGLQAIHELGIVHRDLKPANLTRDVHGVVKVMDFGLAKEWNAEEVRGITGTGQVVGTPEYMSPEQVRGRKIGFRSDVYALGVVVFELFTGDVPFRGDTPIATLLLHLQEAVPLEEPRADAIPEPLRAVLARALAKDAEERFASADDMVAALRVARAETGLPPMAGPAAGRTGDPSASDPDLQPTRIVPHLARTGRRRGTPDPRLLIPPLVRALRNDDKDIRAGAARALGQLGPDAAPALSQVVHALQDTSWEVRIQACHALRKMGPDAHGAGDALRQAGGDADERVRGAAARALARMAAPPAASAVASVPALIPPGWTPPASPPLRPSPSLTFVQPAPGRGRLGRAVGLAFVAASVMAAVALLALRRPRPAAPLPAAPRPPAASAPSAEAGALARIRELEGRLAAMEAQRRAAEEEAVRKARRPARGPAAADPAVVRAAEEQARQRLERELARQRMELEEERQALQGLQASVPPPAPVEPVAPMPAPEAAPPRTAVAPGTLVDAGDPRVMLPVAIAAPPPPYSLLATRLGLQGTVVLRLLVDERGNVREAEALSGSRQLSEAAIRHVIRKWRYRAATLDGVPVRVPITVSIRFEMR
jgi:TonB family protein